MRSGPNSLLIVNSMPDGRITTMSRMNPPVKALNGRERWAAIESAKMNWHEVDGVPTGVLNRILWEDRKGWGAPYPARRAGLKK
jgi:hypothetical protein